MDARDGDDVDERADYDADLELSGLLTRGAESPTVHRARVRDSSERVLDENREGPPGPRTIRRGRRPRRTRRDHRMTTSEDAKAHLGPRQKDSYGASPLNPVRGEHGEQGRAEPIIAESPQVGDHPPASPSRREGCRVSGSRESSVRAAASPTLHGAR